MTLLRWIIGLPIAALVTAGLFAMMAGFIQRESGPLPEMRETPDFQILAQIPKPEPLGPERPKPIDQDPPDIDIPPAQPGDRPTVPANPPKSSEVDLTLDGKSTPVGAPVIRHAPAYPESCRSRAAEGTVLVQFDVTPEGSVVNPQIIESADKCFNRTVLRAVSKWKYPPTYRNDSPVMRYGVVERFSFSLVDK